MSKTTYALIFIAVVFAVGFALLAPAKKHSKSFSAKAKKPLTKNEQPMYYRLVEAFPNLVVLAQVSFSSLLSSSTKASRNQFDRKTADFVLCSKAFEVIAIVELDDSSHNGRQKEDATRDALLTSVGYRVLRFKTTPNATDLQAAVYPPITSLQSG